MPNVPDLRLPGGAIGPPPDGLWEIGDAAHALGTDPDSIVYFAIRNKLPWCMFETPDTAAPDYAVHTFVERAAFVRAWMREHN